MRRPAWTYYTSVYLPKKLCTVYRDDALGVQLQVEVKREWTLFPPKEKSYFFIDGIEKVFRNEARMVRELERVFPKKRQAPRPRFATRAATRPQLGQGQGVLSRSSR